MTALAEDPRVDPEGPPPLKVLIADDHPLMIAGVRRTLEQAEDIEIVGEARSGPHLIDLIERRRPQAVLMDLRMPGVSDASCIEEIRSRWPDVKLVVLSACEDRSSIEAALLAGASAYVVKSVNPTDVASVLRQAAAGGVFHASSGPRAIGGTGFVEEPAKGPELTSRERSILGAVASGMTTAAISKDLWVSEHTVKFHLTNIYRKLGVANRAGAVRYALENGVVGG